jgi:trimeric autotransporter adhesin
MSWLAESEANNLERTYINTFLDVNGNIINRTGYLTVLDGDVSFNNGNLYVGGNITGNYLDKSIPASAIDGQVDTAPNFNGAVAMNDDLTVSKRLFVIGEATAPTIDDNADSTDHIATTAFVQSVISTLDAGPMATNIANNTTAITSEETRATDAETVLQTNIDTNATAITSEVTRANAAETALQTNIDAVVSSLSLDGLSDVKSGGDDFTNSLLIGSTTTGSLDDAKENTGVGSGVFNDLTSGDMCTAIGFQSLYSNTTGGNNTAVGNTALYTNTTGVNNIAVGNKALYSNTTGLSNVANGLRALYTNETGSRNIANGSDALYTNETGNNNCSNGHESLFFNTTGSNNIANGYGALKLNTTGNDNVAIGHQAGTDNVTGDKNTYIGHGANAVDDQTALSNSTAIGYDSKITASNQIMLGTADETVEIPGNLNIASDKIATAPTVNGTADNTNNIATTAFVQAVVATVDAGSMSTSISNKANIDSPVLTGIPEAPTADNTTDTDQIATTKFVQERITTIIGGAPEALDTLKEITDALTGADNVAGAITTTIADNKTAIEAEEARAIAAEGTLQTNINAVSGNLSLNGLSDVKSGGDEFTDSLLIGTTSTGVLDDAKENTGVGSGVFNDLTSGDMCTAIGFQSLYSNTTGGNNTAVGNTALYTNTTGLNNTAVGKKALYSNTTGLSNVANGSNALYTNATGSKNIANGSYALHKNTEGNENVAIGHQAGNVNVTGDKNTYIGHGADAAAGETALSNSTAIGYNAKITESNQIMLGTAAEKVKIPGTELSVGGDVIFTGGLKQDDGAGNLSDFRGGALNIDDTGTEFAHYSNAIHIGGSTEPVDDSKLEVTGDVKISGDIKITGVFKQW